MKFENLLQAIKSGAKSKARFPLGTIVATRAFAMSVAIHSPADALAALRRHVSGDWGDVPPEDAAANDRALVDGDRLLSSYKTPSGVKFWIITEADRSVTTFLLPEDY